MAKSVFNKNIRPCCVYCANAKISTSLKLVFCKYKGPVSENDFCRKYIYDPLKRIPKTSAELPEFSDDDFAL